MVKGKWSNQTGQRARASRLAHKQINCQQRLARVADVFRSPKTRAERAKLKSCKDDTIVAQGKRSAALGYRRKMISFFSSGLARVWRAKPEGKKEVGVVWRFTQGGGLGGLALGYYHAAPRGASEAT